MKCGGPCALILPQDMDHNEFDFNEDLIRPFQQFLRQINVQVEFESGFRGSFDDDSQSDSKYLNDLTLSK